VKSIKWEDYTESIPAFLALIIMPLTFSITEGIAFGFISYAALKLLSGRGREVNAFIYVFAVLFVVRYLIAP
jgi:AGZA family xanthine/uracil permease-like MFS transporter